MAFSGFANALLGRCPQLFVMYVCMYVMYQPRRLNPNCTSLNPTYVACIFTYPLVMFTSSDDDDGGGGAGAVDLASSSVEAPRQKRGRPKKCKDSSDTLVLESYFGNASDATMGMGDI